PNVHFAADGGAGFDVNDVASGLAEVVQDLIERGGAEVEMEQVSAVVIGRSCVGGVRRSSSRRLRWRGGSLARRERGWCCGRWFKIVGGSSGCGSGSFRGMNGCYPDGCSNDDQICG